MRTATLGGDGTAFFDGIGNHAAHEVARTDGVVVAGNDVIDDVGVAVGIDNGHNRHAELVGFGHGDVFLLRVDDEDGVGQLVHATNAAEVLLQLLKLAAKNECFLLGHCLEVACDTHALVLLHLLHTTMDGLEVGQHAAEPTLVDVRHTALGCVAGDRVLRLLLGSDEQDGAAVSNKIADEGVSSLDARERLVEIDDVDAVALTKDESLHLRVPATGLMTKVHACIEQLAHSDDGGSGVHEMCPPVDWSVQPGPRIPCGG